MIDVDDLLEPIIDNSPRAARHAQLSTPAAPVRLKANGRNQFEGRLIRAGRVRNHLNQPGTMLITAEAIRDAVALGLFENLACFIDHADAWRNPSLRNLLGVWHNVSWNAQTQSADGRLTVYINEETVPTVELMRQFLDDAGHELAVPDIGVSLSFYGEWEATNDYPRVLRQFYQVESADLVFFPAADGRILEALSALNNLGINPRNGGNNRMPKSIVGASLVDAQSPDFDKLSRPDDAQPATQKRASAFVQELEDQAQVQTDLSSQWVDEIAQTAVRAILHSSDLPQPVKNRLAKQRYDSPTAVHQAIREAREELQALDQEEVIQLSDRPWIYVKDPQSDIQEHVNWFFGVPDTPPPPPNYRKLDQLYVALTGDSGFHGVFYPQRVMLASATTSTLASMAVDAMNKVVQMQMSRLDFWRWYERVSLPIPNDGSVQSMKLITYGGVGNLPTVAEGSAYTELTVDDVKETAAFSKKGGYVGITMEMIRNSQIVQIQAVPRALAVAAVRTRSAAVSSLFTSNAGVGPTLVQDSTALFHANHSNVATTALGSDLSAWSAARSECFEHSEVNSGKSLAVFPRYLLVPAELYDTALSIMGYGEGMPASYNIAAQSRGPVDPRPIPLVVPDWTDASDWAYIVDPDVYPVIQISYAQAPGGGVHPAPELYSVSNEEQGLIFTNDVMPIKVRDWFAVNVNGPRGIGKRNVA